MIYLRGNHEEMLLKFIGKLEKHGRAGIDTEAYATNKLTAVRVSNGASPPC